MANYTIIPLQTGILSHFDKSSFTYLIDAGCKDDFPLLSFLVLGNRKIILVDSGPPFDPESQKHYSFFSAPQMHIRIQLKRFGIKPEDIDTLILTHLHWDHCYNTELFENAKIYVQRREIEYIQNPLPIHIDSYSAPYYKAVFKPIPSDSRFQYIDGDIEIVSGLTLVSLPGHTPGLQGLLVKTGGIRYLLASDCVDLVENWKGNETYPHIPSTGHNDLVEYEKTFRKIEQIADVVIPGHDKCVLDNSYYGN